MVACTSEYLVLSASCASWQQCIATVRTPPRHQLCVCTCVTLPVLCSCMLHRGCKHHDASIALTPANNGSTISTVQAAVTHAFQSGDGGLTVLGSAVTYEAKEDGDVPTDVQEALARWRVAYDQHQREQREAQHVHAQQVAEASRRVSAVAKARTTPTASAPSSSPPSAPLPPLALSNSTEHSARPLPEAAATSGSRAHSREVRLSGQAPRSLSSNQPQLVAYGGGSQRGSGQLLLQKQQPLSPRVTSSHFVLPEAVEELPSALLVGNQDQAWDDRSLC